MAMWWQDRHYCYTFAYSTFIAPRIVICPTCVACTGIVPTVQHVFLRNQLYIAMTTPERRNNIDPTLIDYPIETDDIIFTQSSSCMGCFRHDFIKRTLDYRRCG